MEIKTHPRRHDLDALRAIAMLLGIVLHAALSFTTLPWVVTDVHQNSFFDILFAAIHGFRMPLFFLLSGFFTAMLWRKRGLVALVKHRLIRIFVPMIIGLVTVVPCMFALTSHFSNESQDGEVHEFSDTTGRAAIISGDLRQFEDLASKSDFDPNFVSPEDGSPLIVTAAFLGRHRMVEFLIHKGADVNSRGSSGGTALHAAAFLGREKCARLLINNGADTQATDNTGAKPEDALKTDWETTSYIANMFRVSVEKQIVLSGRNAIAKLLNVDNITIQDVVESQSVLRQWVQFLTFFPLFFHLWFLWYLCLYVILFVFYSFAATTFEIKDFVPEKLVKTPLCLTWLIPLTMIPLSYMEPGIFGPDTSVGLLPIPRVFFFYSIFFFFGVIYWDFNDEKTEIGKMWSIWLSLALLVIFPAAVLTMAGQIMTEFQYNAILLSFLQSSYVWLMNIGTMGMFHYWTLTENKNMRYLSDSSYWLYLAHLPLIMMMQWWIRKWDVNPFLKFLGICIAVTIVLLLIYQWAIRYSIVGTVLNGPRQRNK